MIYFSQSHLQERLYWCTLVWASFLRFTRGKAICLALYLFIYFCSSGYNQLEFPRGNKINIINKNLKLSPLYLERMKPTVETVGYEMERLYYVDDEYSC